MRLRSRLHFHLVRDAENTPASEEISRFFYFTDYLSSHIVFIIARHILARGDSSIEGKRKHVHHHDHWKQLVDKWIQFEHGQ